LIEIEIEEVDLDLDHQEEEVEVEMEEDEGLGTKNILLVQKIIAGILVPYIQMIFIVNIVET
jgi:hypothetical protein